MEIAQYIPSPASYHAQAAHHITKFFEINELTTQQECDEHAAAIAEQAVSPTAIQGQSSYTVIAADGSIAVQFRPPNQPLDLTSLDSAKTIYGRRFVPACVFCESWRGLFVYTMDALQGDAFAIARQTLYTTENKHILSSTISDYSAFFAASWTNRSSPPPEVKQIYHDYDDRLASLTDTLPPKFYAKLNAARNQLWRIFDRTHPIVLNHPGLSDLNVHIDTTNGRITGVVDWAGALTAPFGISTWGVDIALGVPSVNEWHWHPDHQELRQYFWQTLFSAIGPLSGDEITTIKVGRTVGIFLAFGYCKGVPVEDDDLKVACLDALLAVE
ncbi:hypothetical protein TWF730_004183 [Orbilia blumenaviensis]|uniref:Aminoglycoside phosphotransferase domain-containing protein n=1 Tax=Orbilia blumenaviensis TaxID=1796055 RepID=A0AAV9TZF6_9PEZI